MMDDYIFKPLDLTTPGIEQIAGLLDGVFGASAKFTPEFVDWEYNRNPTGHAVGFNAWAGNELAAHYVTQPLIANLNGKMTKGLLSLNTATHSNHRGKKLFTLLAEKTYAYGLELGYEFVIGVANAYSTPGFLKNLGFSLIAPLDVKFGIGSPDVDFETRYEYLRHWDKALLEWRLNSPKLKYEVVVKKDHFIVLAPTGKFGINAILGSFPLEMLPEKAMYISGSGVQPVRIWMGLDEQLSWKRKIFFQFPNKLKPSPLNLIFRNLTKSGDLPEVSQIKFMSLDFDAY